MKNIYNLTLLELEDFLVLNNKKKYLAAQIFDWIYVKKITDFNSFSNLSKINIDWLKNNFKFELPKLVQIKVDEIDETVKFLFEISGNNLIETVLMKFIYGYSVCVTTQVGCNMGCHFCASGINKKVKDLTSGEIVGQIMAVNFWLLENKNNLISRIVVMGIGEPFDNFNNLINFLDIINHPKGLNISQRHITVSTCGIVPKIREWAILKKQYNLAISLHSPFDEVRSQIMPINNAYPLNELLEAIKYYLSINNRRITIEYILLENINDRDIDAFELIKLFKNQLVYINLIPYNNVIEAKKFSQSKKVKEFYDILRKNKITTTIRQPKGEQIDAACGQLRNQNIRK